MKQLPLNFFIHLQDRLIKRGFKQLKLDPCLFLNGKVVCLIYVNDCLFYAVKVDRWDFPTCIIQVEKILV